MAEEIEQRKRAEVALVAEQEQRLQLQAQLDHARRLEAIGRLAGGVAHDFNNLLTVTTSYTQLLEMDLEPQPDSDAAEFLQGIADCTQKAAELTAQLLTFGRRQHLDRRTFDLGEVVTGLMPMLRRLVRADIELELAPHEGPLSVCVDRGQVEQAVVNLVANAAAAMPSGGAISLSLALARPEDAALRWPDLDLTLWPRCQPSSTPSAYMGPRPSSTTWATNQPPSLTHRWPYPPPRVPPVRATPSSSWTTKRTRSADASTSHEPALARCQADWTKAARSEKAGSNR